MKKITMKRSEVMIIVASLSKITGVKNFQKTISLGRDIRVLRAIQEDTEAAYKVAKPENFDALQEELQELKQKKAKEFKADETQLLNDQVIGSHVLLVWPKAASWIKANKDYNDRINEIDSETVEVELHTEKIEEKDFEKKPSDVATGMVLSYFI